LNDAITSSVRTFIIPSLGPALESETTTEGSRTENSNHAETILRGFPYPVYEELWNYGFPQEMYHFARYARGKEPPIATGEDGRIVQEVLLAGYRSARMGAKIGLPFRPTGIKHPIDLWLGAADEDFS
jgi:predicted dehydrogenase